MDKQADGLHLRSQHLSAIVEPLFFRTFLFIYLFFVCTLIVDLVNELRVGQMSSPFSVSEPLMKWPETAGRFRRACDYTPQLLQQQQQEETTTTGKSPLYDPCSHAHGT